MKQSARLLTLFSFVLLAFAFRSPAPLIYQPGEGWTYDTPGTETGKWQRTRAKDQLEVAQAAYDKHDFDLALKAALRVEKIWPLSDYAPKAQYLIGRCYEAKGNDEKAFKAYQRIIEHNPKAENYQEILARQYDIAGRYLDGQRFKLWNYVPFLPDMDKTAGMYEKIIKSGPYSDIGAKAQLKLGEAREKQSEPTQAVKAYEAAADRYNDRPQIAADALYKTGLAYKKQSKSAEYDQHVANQSIAAFTDFMTLYPSDPRVPEARKMIAELKTRAAAGSFSIAQYYELKNKLSGALIYYNDVLVQDANSPLAGAARQKIAELKQKLGVESPAPTTPIVATPTATTPTATVATPITPTPTTVEPVAPTPAPATPTTSTTANATGPKPPIATFPSSAAPDTTPTPASPETQVATKSGGNSWWYDFSRFRWLPSAPKAKSAANSEEKK